MLMAPFKVSVSVYLCIVTFFFSLKGYDDEVQDMGGYHLFALPV